MLCSLGTIGGGLQTLYDRGGPFLLGPAPPESPLPHVQRGTGDRVTRVLPTGTLWGGPGGYEGTPPPPPHPDP